jgi:chromosome segregation ATPase
MMHAIDHLYLRIFLLLILPVILLCGCTEKEGAQFYALQSQDDQLYVTVSNLQQQVKALATQNSVLKGQLDTNAMAIALLMKDQSSLQKDLTDITNGFSLYDENYYDLSNKLHTLESQEAGDLQKLRSDISKFQKAP